MGEKFHTGKNPNTFLSGLCISTKYAQKIYETLNLDISRHLMEETPKTHHKISFIDNCISAWTGTVLIRWTPVIESVKSQALRHRHVYPPPLPPAHIFYSNKRPTDLDSRLSIIALRLTSKKVSCLQFKLYFEIEALV